MYSKKDKHLLSQVLVVDDKGIEVRKWRAFMSVWVRFHAKTVGNCENRCWIVS